MGGKGWSRSSGRGGEDGFWGVKDLLGRVSGLALAELFVPFTKVMKILLLPGSSLLLPEGG